MAREREKMREEAGGRLLIALRQMADPARGEVADLVAALPLPAVVRTEVLRLAATPEGADLSAASAWSGLAVADLGPALAAALIELWPSRERLPRIAWESWQRVQGQARAGGAA